MHHLSIALNEYGIKSVAGIFSNPEVLKYFREIGHAWVKNDDIAWCAAFANWCLMKAGKQHTGKLNARSFLSVGVVTNKPEVGDIVVLWRIAKEGPYGHVGFFIKEYRGSIYILGGNQSEQVNIMPFSKQQLLGYRHV